MKILLVETSPLSKTSDVTVHVRNSIEIYTYLKQQNECRLVSDEADITDVDEQFDYIIFISATFYFKHEKFTQLMNNQKKCKIGWLTNEFELFANDFLKGRMDFIIANFEEWGVKSAHKHNKYLMTNLNAMQARPRNDLCEKKYDICYYGTYRKYREKYFQKYFASDIVLSTSGKNIKKFLLSGCDCCLTDKFSWEPNKETLNLFKASLYIEDSKTHKLYNHLANRFYEGLFCNCALFFDKSCINTIKKSGYDIPDYFIVDSYEEAIEKTNMIDKDLLNNFLTKNTIKALNEKQQCFKEVEQFLINY